MTSLLENTLLESHVLGLIEKFASDFRNAGEIEREEIDMYAKGLIERVITNEEARKMIYTAYEEAKKQTP
jgi:flagellar motor switch protein FliG